MHVCFQVPRERRRISSGVKPTEVASAAGPANCGSLEMLDHHLQALRSMPVNLSLNSSAAAEHQGSKYGASCLAADTRGGEGKGGGGAAALARVKTEGHQSMGVSCSVGAYQEEPREHMRMVFEEGSYGLPLAEYLKDEQRRSPDSSQEDSVDGEVRPQGETGEGGSDISPSNQVLPPALILLNTHHVLSFDRCTTEVPPQELLSSTTADQCEFKFTQKQKRAKES